MSELSRDQDTPASGPDGASPGGVSGRDAEEGAFPRLQERSQTQLGFINSLLVTLAVGLLAFAANASASGSELGRLGWRKWLLFAGLLVLGAGRAQAGLQPAGLASHHHPGRQAPPAP